MFKLGSSESRFIALADKYINKIYLGTNLLLENLLASQPLGLDENLNGVSDSHFTYESSNTDATFTVSDNQQVVTIDSTVNPGDSCEVSSPLISVTEGDVLIFKVDGRCEIGLEIALNWNWYNNGSYDSYGGSSGYVSDVDFMTIINKDITVPAGVNGIRLVFKTSVIDGGNTGNSYFKNSYLYIN